MLLLLLKSLQRLRLFGTDHVNFNGIMQFRRLRVAVITGLVLLGYLVGVAWLPRIYQCQASVVLLGARHDGGGLRAGRDVSTSLAVHALARVMTSLATVKSLSARGYPERYTVAADASIAGQPVLTITVTGRDRVLVQQTLMGVLVQLSAELGRLQAVAPGAGRIQIAGVSGLGPDLAAGQTLRPYLIAAVLGLMVALGIPVVIDGRAGSRPAARGTGQDRAGRLT